MKSQNKNLGFSLLELLVVISIIAVLAAAAVGSFRVANQKSRNARREADIEQLRSALEIYREDNGVYPNLECNSTAMGENAGDPTCWKDLLDTLGLTGDLTDPYYAGQDKTNPDYVYEYVGGGQDNPIGNTTAKSYFVCRREEPDSTDQRCSESPVK